MGVQSVALEHHGDVPVLGLHIVDKLAVDVQLAAGDFLQAGHHAQGGGLAAAGRANQHDEFLVSDVQVEGLDSDNALLRDLQVGLLLRLTLLLLGFLLVVAVGVDLLDVLQVQSCHNVRL